MERIASFSVDHDFIEPGIYVSRVDGDITTYDLRTRKPSAGDYMDNSTMHTFEHLFATYIRNGFLGGQIIYFGPMGCQTGFYLLVRNADNKTVLRAVMDALRATLAHEGAVFGGAQKECGNYRTLSLEAAKKESRRYLDLLGKAEQTFQYAQGEG